MTRNIGGKISETILRLWPGPQIGLSQSLSQSQSQSQSQMRKCPTFWGGHAPQIFDTPSFGFGFDFDWDFDWDNPIFLTQVSGLAIRISKGSKNEVGLRL